MDGRAVVELARAAINRLGAAAPVADAARDAFAAIEKFGVGAPYTVAIAGDVAARSALLNRLAGEPLFDPGRREPARIMMSMRRGEVTALRARNRDGSVEERKLGATASGALIVDESAIVEEEALEPVAVAVAVEGASEPAPPWWAFWRWLARWFRAWRARRARVALEAPSSPSQRGSDGRRRFVETLRELAARDAVERLFIEVGSGPLPDKIVVIELPSRADPKGLAAMGADACFVACGARGVVLTKQLEAVLAIVPHVFAVGPAAAAAPADPRVRRIGDFADAAPQLAAIAKSERAIAVGRRAIAALRANGATLDKLAGEAEAKLRSRSTALEARRGVDPDEHCAAVLLRVRTRLTELAYRAVERALTRLDAELERLAGEWAARLDEASSADELRAASAGLDEDSPGAAQTVHAAIQRELVDELTEHAHALCDDLVAELWGDAASAQPPPTWLTLDISLDDPTAGLKLGTVTSRLAGLFRSLDSRKADTRTRLDEGLGKLREALRAHLTEAEPRLEPAMRDAIACVLKPELERRRVWLDAELARIAAERAGLADLAAVRDAAREDGRVLAEAVAALEAALPR